MPALSAGFLILVLVVVLLVGMLAASNDARYALASQFDQQMQGVHSSTGIINASSLDRDGELEGNGVHVAAQGTAAGIVIPLSAMHSVDVGLDVNSSRPVAVLDIAGSAASYLGSGLEASAGPSSNASASIQRGRAGERSSSSETDGDGDDDADSATEVSDVSPARPSLRPRSIAPSTSRMRAGITSRVAARPATYRPESLSSPERYSDANRHGPVDRTVTSGAIPAPVVYGDRRQVTMWSRRPEAPQSSPTRADRSAVLVRASSQADEGFRAPVSAKPPTAVAGASSIDSHVQSVSSAPSRAPVAASAMWDRRLAPPAALPAPYVNALSVSHSGGRSRGQAAAKSQQAPISAADEDSKSTDLRSRFAPRVFRPPVTWAQRRQNTTYNSSTSSQQPLSAVSSRQMVSEPSRAPHTAAGAAPLLEPVQVIHLVPSQERARTTMLRDSSAVHRVDSSATTRTILSHLHGSAQAASARVVLVDDQQGHPGEWDSDPELHVPDEILNSMAAVDPTPAVIEPITLVLCIPWVSAARQ